MGYLTQDAVHQAVEELRASGIGRAQASLWRWLLLKTLGLGPNTTATFTSERCFQFAKEWVEVNVHDPEEPRAFQPFTGSWTRFSTPTTTWSTQTLYTQLTRQLTPKESRIWQHSEGTGVAGEWSIQGTDPSSYVLGLSDLFRQRVPLLSLAVWRYRETDLPEETTDETALCQRLVSELQLRTTELEAVFASERPDVVTVDAEGG